jgi:glutamate 5-kinase
VEIARDAGCGLVIAHGREQRVIARLLAGEAIGTLFDAEGALKNRIRWLKNSQPKGSITVDEGALAAMKAHKSLLPRGVLAVEGDFGKNSVSVVMVNRSAKLISHVFLRPKLPRLRGEKNRKKSKEQHPGARAAPMSWHGRRDRLFGRMNLILPGNTLPRF